MRDDETNLEQTWEAEGAASGCKALAILLYPTKNKRTRQRLPSGVL